MKRLVLVVCLMSLCGTSFAEFENKIVRDRMFGCTEREDFDNLMKIATQKDINAFAKLLAVKMMAGSCTLFKLGEIVYLTDTAIFSGMVEVRRSGESSKFWTIMEGVKLDSPAIPTPQKPVEQVKVQMTPQLKKELEAKKCTELKDDSEVMTCLNKVYAPK